MNINPFDDILAKKNQEVSNLSADLKTINQELAWYEGTELTVLTCHHEALCLDLKKQSHECDQLSEKIEEKTSKYRDVSVSVKSIWNPKNWFDAEQRSLRSRANNLKNSLEQEKETLSKAQKKSQKISHGIQNKIEEIERYKDFDFNKKINNEK